MELCRSVCIWIILLVATVYAATDTNPEIPTHPAKSTSEETEQESTNTTISPSPEKTNNHLNPVNDRGTETSSEKPTDNGSAVPNPSNGNHIPYYYIPISGSPGMPGLPGTQGNPGYPGPQGSMGYAGTPGNNGNNGTPGPMGRQGIKGQKGEHGFTGLQGTPGIPGKPGNNGERGDPGLDSVRGPIGTSGKQGRTGSSGPIGPTGVRGTIGKSGPPGLRGVPGNCDCTQAMTYQRAFSVARTTSLTATNGHMIITWNHEFANVGGDFDINTGIFNVTVPGTYFFTIHVYKSSRQNFPLVQLLKNGDHVIGVIDYGPNDSEDSSGNSVVLTLAKGDAVWLLLYDGKEIYSNHYKFTTFSGFLLFPNLE